MEGAGAPVLGPAQLVLGVGDGVRTMPAFREVKQVLDHLTRPGAEEDHESHRDAGEEAAHPG